MTIPRLTYALCALAAATLVACGGSSGSTPPDPLQKYREQTVQWTECDATLIDRDKVGPLWDQAGDRLRCALVQAPMDWAKPERGDVTLSLMRLAAAQPGQRRGALLFNPGGPGEDGLIYAFWLMRAFADSDPADPQGARQLRLLDEYDMVGFSPRGTGASTQLHCGTNEQYRPTANTLVDWDTPENMANLHYNARKTAEACGKNPLTPYINTDATARDMDLMRGLLGDDKLNYVGISYGTWLGAWYASLFPEKVGRMVLDSAVDFTAGFEEMTLSQPPARQRLFDEVLAPYAVRHADIFRLGATEAELRAVMPGLSPRVQHALAIPLSSNGYQRKQADEYLNNIAAARGLDAVLRAAPDPAQPNAVLAALRQHTFDPADPARNAVLLGLATTLLQIYVTKEQHEPTPVRLDGLGTAVRCNDTAATTDEGAWTTQVRGVAQRAPMYFPTLLMPEVHACTYWGGPKVAKPGLAALRSLDVLFVQSQYDSATYTDGANALFAQLPGARRVYVPGDFQHGVFPYQDGCVDPAVTRYLLGESPAQRETACPAHPLAQDAAALPKAATTSAFKHPRQASEWIDAFKRGLVPPPPRQ